VESIKPVDPTKPPTGFQRMMHSIGMSSVGRWYGINIASRIDPPLLKLTGGRFATTGFFPLLLMTAPGRKSGESRTVTLVYFTQDDEVILTASSFGRAGHPAWYFNAVASGKVSVTQGGRTWRCRVRETEGAERDRLFELSKRLYDGYRLYEQRAGERVIPVLALRPAEAAAVS
jgi:deazaflavin-dependent oxidoreductase (nitroreductase family)